MKKITLIFTMCIFLSACGSSLEEGVTAYKAKQYEKALKIFTEHRDNPIAQFYLYEMYSDAQGTAKDSKKALEYLKQAADQGNPDALVRLASHYQWGKDKNEEESLRLYLAAASKGRKSAYVSIGYLTSDKKKAFQYYLQAAGTPLGDWNLARIYETGDRDSILPDPKRSFSYMQAVEKTNREEAEPYNLERFKLDLAEYYYYGFGTQKNDAEAIKILSSFKDQSEEAKAFYAWMLFWGEGMNANPSEAVRIWLPMLDKAVKEQEQKKDTITLLNTYAFYGLAIAFTDGRGIAANPSQVAIFKKGSKIVSDSSNSATLMNVKYNTLGYLDKECNSSALMVVRESDIGRYRPLYADALFAISKCMSKATSFNRIQAFEHLMEASKLGNIEAQKLAKEQWNSMSQKERSAFSNAQAAHANFQQQVDDLAKLWAKINKPGVRIGMTQAEAIDTKWGKPEHINKTTNARGTQEQWVYGSGNYLYFENGILTTIQN